MVTRANGKTRYLVQSRANWTFLDTSSDYSPERGSRTEDAHTSFLPILPCSHTCHNYTVHDLPRAKKKRWKQRSETKWWLCTGKNKIAVQRREKNSIKRREHTKHSKEWGKLYSRRDGNGKLVSLKGKERVEKWM